MNIGRNTIPNHGIFAENKAKKRKGCLLWFLIIGIAYILLTLWAQWTPPVRGVVVDAETGKPIEGVEIIREGCGWAISGIGIVSTAGCKKSDEKGRFSIWGTLESTMSKWWSYFVPIWSIDKVDLYLYHPDYVTTFTEVEIGKIGMTDIVVTRRESFEERRFLYESMRFKIRLVKPQTERDWIEKCDQDIRSYMNFQDRHGVDKWLFNDLVGYLERFSNGERAGDFALLLLDRLAIGDSRANVDEELRSGELDRMKIKLILERNTKIIEVTSKVKPPGHPGVVVTFPDYKQRQESVNKCTSYLKELYEKGGLK